MYLMKNKISVYTSLPWIGFSVFILVLGSFLLVNFSRSITNTPSSSTPEAVSTNISYQQIQVSKEQQKKAEELGLKRMQLIAEKQWSAVYQLLHPDSQEYISSDKFIAELKKNYGARTIENISIKRIIFYQDLYFTQPQKTYRTVASIVVKFSSQDPSGKIFNDTNDGSWFLAWEKDAWYILWFK